MILCCMCFLQSWLACIFLKNLVWFRTQSFVCCFWFFIPILFYLFVPPSLVGCTSCVPVLSLPVQCWSLSYGKQRRPFRLCAPTWLRQQVWRSFYLFCTWSLFLLQPSLSLSLFFAFLCEFLWMISAQHLSRLIFLPTFSESEIPSQERKNYKSSPEIQVGNAEMLKPVQSVFLWGTLMLKALHVPSLQEPIRPLEKRALNFLVNEYLLKSEYKLSSITFSDENDDQVKFSAVVSLKQKKSHLIAIKLAFLFVFACIFNFENPHLLTNNEQTDSTPRTSLSW